jgi:AraC family transcriptional regulator
MSTTLQSAPTGDAPQAAGTSDLATRVLWLLQTATNEMERDRDVARSFITRASSLLQIEADRRASDDIALRRGGLAPWQIRRVKAFVEEHLDQSISIRDLSGVACLSSTYFARAFKHSFGEAPHAYIVYHRLKRARHLMLASDIALSELAFTCGFADQAHLCKVFRRSTGITPAAWRREHREAIPSAEWPPRLRNMGGRSSSRSPREFSGSAR